VRVYGIALQVDFVDVLEHCDGLQLPHEVVLGDQSFHPAHTLEVVERLQLVIRNVHSSQVLELGGHLLRKNPDQIIREVQDLHADGHDPRSFDLVV